MPPTTEKTQAESGGLLRLAREHPVVTTLLVTLAILGSILGGLYLPPEWSVIRRVAAGALSGAGIGFFVVASRLIG